ncbi:hypothetical protein HYALB_00009133 [Hymenoscyphus albidus]|uniref:Uncharacterized protein n=1 Tax=Hymenoscyphus albidus TaxID=595503 RepID=A0A9N9LQH4_9HELO|nr:hypothetical protein HYALB_00009133 [Hymenoscyphus albidus]
MDIVSRKFVTKQSRYFYSGILEGKKPNYDQDDVDTVEQQLHEYSSAYIDSCDETSLWGFTTLGTKIRFWFYKRASNGLVAYLPQTTASYTDAPYIDANARETEDLEAAFEYIRNNPWPTKNTRGVSPDIPAQPPSTIPFSGTTVSPLRLTSHPHIHTVPPATTAQASAQTSASTSQPSSSPYTYKIPPATTAQAPPPSANVYANTSAQTSASTSQPSPSPYTYTIPPATTAQAPPPSANVSANNSAQTSTSTSKLSPSPYTHKDPPATTARASSPPVMLDESAVNKYWVSSIDISWRVLKQDLEIYLPVSFLEQRKNDDGDNGYYFESKKLIQGKERTSMFADLKADSAAWKKEGTRHYSESKTHKWRKKHGATYYRKE